ncbi:hypothetical protein GHT06_019525 [Daphnia sinensis]|uniref:CWH43-like N-terminal domain-containing protein n=1 Tax=Daphnia sinensis TaxID=1820382 RepID=A0AAD5LAU0_9CRUS|nr:hypothetical protein GHT06_019525 [Daphnia sinensis]
MTSVKENRQNPAESSPTYCNCQDAANTHLYQQHRSYVRFNFSQLCRFTVSLPLIGLVICFVSANIFQQNDIHETHCRVYNVIPSISAITGISPQRYIWRIVIALHVGPRFLTSLVYHRFYLNQLSRVSQLKKKSYLCHVWLALSLNLVEQAALIGVTYVSNRENYPIHEKIFVVFMVSSQVHMLIVLKLLKMADFGREQQSEQRSYFFKRSLFFLSLLCTCGLLVFFVKHRVYCHDMAFSWFSFFEYWIAATNMGFHATIIIDFPDEDIIVGSSWSSSKTKIK